MTPSEPSNLRFAWLISAILVVAIIVIWFWCYLWPVQTTTVYIVRHAERANSSANTPLSAAGQARADELARVLGDEGITAVFVSEFLRTHQTGAPTAAAASVAAAQYQAADAQGVADTILADHAGGRILLVGHSNTVDDLATALGATGLSDLSENEFDRLFVVHRFGDVAHLDRLRYGAQTP